MKIYDVEQWTPEWHKLRAWVITGTKLKWAIAKTAKAQETAIFTLIWEEFFPPIPIFESEAMQRGKFLEEFARWEYEKMTGHKIETIGFAKSMRHTDKYWKWLWISPDWLIQNEEGKYVKWVEIKCFQPTNYIRTFLTNEIPDENFDQVLTYFLIFPDMLELDFVIYNPDCYIDQKIKIINVKRESIYPDLLETDKKLAEFRKLWIENILKFIPNKK